MKAAETEGVTELDAPRWEDGRALLIAGLQERYRWETHGEIPLLWQRFVPFIGNIQGQVGGKTYGVIFNSDGKGKFDYMAGVEVGGAEGLPAELRTVSIPEQRYVVFSHRGPISEMPGTMRAIWTQWIPRSGYTPLATPNYELYPEHFNPATTRTGVEIWIPIRK
jgi:AraC family transcriptional regulator